MPGGDFDGQIDYLEQFGSSTVSFSFMSLFINPVSNALIISFKKNAAPNIVEYIVY